MTKEEWLSFYDATKDKFMWFVRDYFVGIDKRLENARAECNVTLMMDLMNNVWFALPDGRFNIIENPPGWSEFLNLIESETKD